MQRGEGTSARHSYTNAISTHTLERIIVVVVGLVPPVVSVRTFLSR